MEIGFGIQIKPRHEMKAKPTLTPEILVPRLGDYLLEKGLISRQVLEKALQIQRVRRIPDQPVPLIGNILIEINAIDRATLDEAITEQILQLRNALESSNQQLEQRVLERTAELEQALAKLAELNQLKSNFISNISHELRTPLTHVKGYLELLAARDLGPLTTDQEQAIFIMEKSSARLERLIEDLILFSNAENEQINLQIQPFELNRLFDDVLLQSSTKSDEHKVTIQQDYPAQLPKVNADREKIGWVILQLVDNAIKFSNPGGKVLLKAETENNFVNISVIDNGIGIPEDKIEEIFEPFHQLDGSSTRKFGGTGLGLSLARKIIEAHGSILRVTSKINQGSKFNFLLIANKNSSSGYDPLQGLRET